MFLGLSLHLKKWRKYVTILQNWKNSADADMTTHTGATITFGIRQYQP